MLRFSIRSLTILTLSVCIAFFGMIFVAQSVFAQTDSYDTFVINSPLNTSLRITATPLELDNTTGQWTYRIDWKRVRNAQGSLYITKESNSSTVILALSPAAQSGSKTVTLAPDTIYRVKFYGAPAKGGTLILSKKLPTLSVSDENPDVDADYDNSAVGTGTGTGTGSSVVTVANTGTGSFDPAVDNKTTNTFYIAPKSQVKTGSRPAYFFIRIGKYGSQTSVVSEFQNVPKGMNITMFRLNTAGSIDDAWYAGNKLAIGQYDAPFNVNSFKAVGQWLGTYQRWLKTGESLARSQYGGDDIISDLILRSGEMGFLKVDTDTDFTSGPGTYTIKAIETTGLGTTATKKEVTFSVVVGDQMAQCLNDLKGWPNPIEKSPKTIQNAFQLSGDPNQFKEYCDPTIGHNASNFPNFLGDKKPLLQDCVDKAQRQANALGVPMTCSIINTQFSTEPRYRAGCILAGTAYEFQAADLVGTGYAMQYTFGRWESVATTILQQQAMKISDRGFVYYDNDSGAWRVMGQTVADAPESCDKLLDVDVKDINKNWNITRHAQSVVGGSVVPIEISTSPSIKSVNLYLLMDSTNGSNAREWWYYEHVRPGGTSWSSWIGDVAAGQSPFRNQKAYPEYHPQVTLTMQRVSLVNGKATVQWTVPSKLSPFQDIGWGENGSSGIKPPIQYNIRAVADNGVWSDSPAFSILSNSQAAGYNGGGSNNSTVDPNVVQSITGGVWNGKIVLFKSFGVMGQATAPLDVYITGAKSTYAPGDQHPRGDDPYPITAGKQIQVSGTMFNNGGTKKVDVDLLKINSGCTKKTNQIYSDFQLCERDSYATPEKIWSIARDVSSTIRVVTDPDGTNTWFFTYIFTIPTDAPTGRYIIRLVDPDFIYGVAGQERGSAIYDRQGGVAFSASFDVTGGTVSATPASPSSPVPVTNPVVTASPTPTATVVRDPDGVGGGVTPDTCGMASVWWFRNGASAWNLYKSTTNNLSSAQKILSNIPYDASATTGGNIDGWTTKIPGGTYYYWVENVGGQTKVPSFTNTTGGLVVSACR